MIRNHQSKKANLLMQLPKPLCIGKKPTKKGEDANKTSADNVVKMMKSFCTEGICDENLEVTFKKKTRAMKTFFGTLKRGDRMEEDMLIGNSIRLKTSLKEIYQPEGDSSATPHISTS